MSKAQATISPVSYEKNLNMNSILIVDDDTSFQRSLRDGLEAFAGDMNIINAENGLDAVSALEKYVPDLVVTDLRMPDMDGLELLVYIHNNFNWIPVIVMTAYGGPDAEHYFNEPGGIQYLEKPLDFLELAVRINESIALKESGFFNGVRLTQIMQMLEVLNKTCTLTVYSEERLGHIFFSSGQLLDADYGKLAGTEAAIAMACWEDAQIVLKNSCPAIPRKIDVPIRKIIMRARIKKFYAGDRGGRKDKIDGGGNGSEPVILSEMTEFEEMMTDLDEFFTSTTKEKLQEFAAIDGFYGVGIFSPDGVSLGTLHCPDKDFDIESFGGHVNNILLNAQTTALQMGFGNGELVHFETEQDVQMLIKCLNENVDPLRSQQGKAHIHLFLILSNNASVGLAKMKLGTITEMLAADFR